MEILITDMELKELYGKEIIVFGTGKWGRSELPYLMENPELKIVGITNSRVSEDENGTFRDTGLPIRNIKAWKRQYPNAKILIVADSQYHFEILDVCKKANFSNEDILQMTFQMSNEVRDPIYKAYFEKHGISIPSEGEKEFFVNGVTLLSLPNELKMFRASFYGIVIDVILAHDDPESSFIDEGPYDHEESDLQPGDIVLDCGANVGVFSAYAASKGCICYAFEPIPSLQPLLSKYNKLSQNRIIPVSAAVSDQTGTARFGVVDEWYSSSCLTQVPHNEMKDREIEVPQITVDEFVLQHQLTHVDFIKADIEGAERLMLAGAKDTLAKFSPKLSLCTYHLPDDREVLTKLILSANPNYRITYYEKKLFASVPNKN